MANEVKKLIKGKEWTFRLVTRRKFNNDYPSYKEAGALCVPEDKECVFIKGELTFEYVMHECLHSYFYESDVKSSDLKKEQEEELYCEIVSGNYFDIGKTTYEVFVELSKKDKKDRG